MGGDSAREPVEVLPGIWMWPGWDRSYLVLGDPLGWPGNILVDPPEPAEAAFDFVRARGGALYLFICHRDDVGGAAEWLAALGLEVAIHRLDAPFLPRGLPHRAVEDGDALLPGTRVVHLPGHSPGSAALWVRRPDGNVLFTGDALLGREDGSLALPPSRYSDDIAQAEQSLFRLLELDFEAVLSARGVPVLAGGRHLLEDLLQRPGR